MPFVDELFPTVAEIVGLVASDLLGFVLWLLVMPIRLLVAFFDPIFSPITALFDFSGFSAVLGQVAGFFNDVNYFVPLYAMVSIMQVTIGVAFVLACIHSYSLMTISYFGDFSIWAAKSVLRNIVDKGKQLLEKVITFFFGGMDFRT